MPSSSLWPRFQQYFLVYEDLDFSIDISRMRFPDGFFAKMAPLVERAFAAMRELEAGAIANPDENRMVGHYWLRDSKLAPTTELRADIDKTNAKIKQFATDIHSGRVGPQKGGRFKHLLLIGIGGSRLDLNSLLTLSATSPIHSTFIFWIIPIPDGFDRTFKKLGAHLAETLTVVISKSGGTKETRNGMLEATARYERAGLDFGKHAVAVTGIGSELDQHAEKNRWLLRLSYARLGWWSHLSNERSRPGPGSIGGF
jgi:glucose-6-phosphate isomerase